MSIIKKLASQTAIYGIPTMLGRFLNYLLVPLYLQKLESTADYGVVSVMFTIASFMAIVVSLGLETGFFRFAKLTENPTKVFATTSITLIFTGLIFTLLTQSFASNIMAEIGYPQHPEYATWFAVILATDALSALGFAWLRQQNQAWKFAAIRITNILINILANLFFLLLCPYLLQQELANPAAMQNPSAWIQWLQFITQPTQMVANIFLSNLIASVITLFLFGNVWKNLKAGLDIALLKSIFSYSLPLILVGLAGMINETLDRLLLKHLLPESIADSQTGIYGAFYKLSLVLTLFIQAFKFAAEPFFFSKSGDRDAPHTYAYVMKYFIYAVGGIYVFTLAIMPYLAPLLLRKPVYFQNADGLHIIPVLLLANLCLGIYYNLSIWYKLSGNTTMGAIVATTGAAITIAGNYWGIPKYGFVASAYTTLFAYATMVVISYLTGQKFYPVPYKVFRLLAILIIATFPITFLYYHPDFQLPISIAWARFISLIIFVIAIIVNEKTQPSKFHG